MSRRLLALAVSALALLVSAGCADDVSPAARIGDVKISNDELLDEVAEWVGNPAAIDPATVASTTPGSYPLELVRQLLQQRLDFELHRQEFDELGLEVDDDLRQQALTVLFGDPAAADDAFAAFSEEFAASFVDDVARQIAVQNELGEEGYAAWRTAAYGETDIEVNPRYGTWDAATGQIIAPSGPVQPATFPVATP
ncbi:MAG: hypothetical protein ACRDZU_09140 [Acidimicrobiales bacterium]